MNHSRWPVHPHPVKEEAILSWLSRIAICYGLGVSELLHDLDFHGDPNDLTMSIPHRLLESLSNRTGVEKQKIYALTVISWRLLLGIDSDFESYAHHYSLLLSLNQRKRYFPKKAWRPWFPSSWSSPKACPECAISKDSNVMLLVWYLPIMLSCPIHQCVLHTCFSIHGRYIMWKKDSDLEIPHSPAIQNMDRRTWSALTTGEVKLPRRTVHGAVWLRLLRTLLDELHIPISSKIPTYTNMVSIWDALGLTQQDVRSRWCPYEELTFQSQQITLMVAATAIEQIENKTIHPPGKTAYLFLEESKNNEDLPSLPPKLNYWNFL